MLSDTDFTTSGQLIRTGKISYHFKVLFKFKNQCEFSQRLVLNEAILSPLLP